jgi:hypothetical protein
MNYLYSDNINISDFFKYLLKLQWWIFQTPKTTPIPSALTLVYYTTLTPQWKYFFQLMEDTRVRKKMLTYSYNPDRRNIVHLQLRWKDQIVLLDILTGQLDLILEDCDDDDFTDITTPTWTLFTVTEQKHDICFDLYCYKLESSRAWKSYCNL